MQLNADEIQHKQYLHVYGTKPHQSLLLYLFFFFFSVSGVFTMPVDITVPNKCQRQPFNTSHRLSWFLLEFLRTKLRGSQISICPSEVQTVARDSRLTQIMQSFGECGYCSGPPNEVTDAFVLPICGFLEPYVYSA